MAKTIVTEKAVRELIRHLFENKDMGSVFLPRTAVERPIEANPVVDPSAALTDKDHKNQRPQNSVELQVAIKKITNDLPDVEASKIYDTVIDALEKDDEDQMKKPSKKNVEESIRAAVRKMLDEGWITDPKTGGTVWQDDKKKTATVPPPVTGPLPPVKKIPMGVMGGEAERRFQKTKQSLAGALNKPSVLKAIENEAEVESDVAKRKNVTMTDVQGASFQQIADELGFAVSGAKQAVDKALSKLQWLTSYVQASPEDFEVMTLTAMNDYISYLNKSGELTSEDVTLLKSHPDIVQSLDGFREFLDKYIRKARKTSGAAVEESRQLSAKKKRLG